MLMVELCKPNDTSLFAIYLFKPWDTGLAQKENCGQVGATGLVYVRAQSHGKTQARLTSK